MMFEIRLLYEFLHNIAFTSKEIKNNFVAANTKLFLCLEAIIL